MATTSARSVARSGRWIEPVARAAHAVNATVYALLGALTLVGIAGPIDHRAPQALGSIPYSAFPLTLIALGLLALGGWRVTQALLDPLRTSRSRRARDVVDRLSWLAGGALHLALGFATMELALGAVRTGRGVDRAWLIDVVRWDPMGPALGVSIGALVILYALAQIHRAWFADLSRDLRVSEMTARQRRRALRIGRVGVFARGVAFVLVGAGVIQLALDRSIIETRGLGGALRDVAEQPRGAALIAIVALGLIAYAVHQLVEARFRRIPSL